MKESEGLSPKMLSSPSSLQASLEEELLPEHRILIELIEDIDKRREVMRKVEAIEDLLQIPEELKQEKIQLWADRLGKHPRTITRWLEKAEEEGLASIARGTRSDAGQVKGEMV